MAGDWIPMRMDLADDPAVIVIAASTGLSSDAVVGKLHRLWCWANRHLKNGCAPGVTEKWVDDFLGATGFAKSMIEAGWIRVKNGGIVFVNFDRWNSQGAKKRVLATERMRRSRDAKRDAASATEAQPEKRREEKRDKDILADGPQGRKERARDELFDAVAEVTASDPKASGSHVAKVANALKGAIPPYTPDDVREFARRLGEFCPWAAKDGRTRPELGELGKHIGKLRDRGKQPPPGPAFDPMQGHTEMDYEAKRNGRYT